jgi:hypothetical protein
MEKYQRKQVHEIAEAFNLKSQSKGFGAARYTTLRKTTRSGVNVDEPKISRWLARSGGVNSFLGPVGKDKGKEKMGVPQHKEGDEVGKVNKFVHNCLQECYAEPMLCIGSSKNRAVECRF